MVTVLAPTLNGITCDKLPDATDVPLTVMVAVASLAVGVNCIEAKLFGTAAVKFRYPGPDVVNNETAGVAIMEASKALVDGAVLVILAVYVLVVVPFCAVTTVLILFNPTLKLTVEAEPEVAGAPFTVTVALDRW